jgi:hypothetical protein
VSVLIVFVVFVFRSTDSFLILVLRISDFERLLDSPDNFSEERRKAMVLLPKFTSLAAFYLSIVPVYANVHAGGVCFRFCALLVCLFFYPFTFCFHSHTLDLHETVVDEILRKTDLLLKAPST